MMQFPQCWFMYGDRYRYWHKMAKVDFKGREHWHPAFKHWDHHLTRKLDKVERRQPGKDKRSELSVRKIVPPVPNEDQTSIFWKRPTHQWGPADDDWRNE